jgi:hypothetical protein
MVSGSVVIVISVKLEQNLWLRVVDLPDDPASRRPPKQKMACAQQAPLPATVDAPWLRINFPFRWFCFSLRTWAAAALTWAKGEHTWAEGEHAWADPE